jgi:hypothetical protein
LPPVCDVGTEQAQSKAVALTMRNVFEGIAILHLR